LRAFIQPDPHVVGPLEALSALSTYLWVDKEVEGEGEDPTADADTYAAESFESETAVLVYSVFTGEASDWWCQQFRRCEFVVDLSMVELLDMGVLLGGSHRLGGLRQASLWRALGLRRVVRVLVGLVPRSSPGRRLPFSRVHFPWTCVSVTWPTRGHVVGWRRGRIAPRCTRMLRFLRLC
jgi:hypothetical protein